MLRRYSSTSVLLFLGVVGLGIAFLFSLFIYDKVQSTLASPIWIFIIWAALSLAIIGVPLGLLIWWANASDKARAASINAHTEWNEETRQSILKRGVSPGMAPAMVELSWGKPTAIDQKETTAKSTKERWVYGVAKPRQPARYVWFIDGKVSKIKA